MSARKSERLVNLLIALLSTRRFLSKAEVRDAVEGYRGTSTQAFERQFERDKQELRAIGIEVETGSNEIYFEGEEHGYRISRSSFELPELHFTSAELAALALAGEVWQDTLAADHTARAFEALRAGGAAPDPARVPTVRPRVDVREPDFDTVYDATLAHRVIAFGYRGKQRKLQPWVLLQRRGRWYVFGFDVDREDTRFFKLARFTAAATAIGKANAFEVPADARERATALVPDGDATALVALRDDAPIPAGAQPAEHDSVPDGYTPWRMRSVSVEALVAEIVMASADVLVLEPRAIRTRVISALEKAAA